MKSIIFCILFLSVLGISAQNRTYYYERIAKVKNGNKSMDSGDGHYLTINNKILYESDENGFSKKKGTVTYMNSNNNRPMYEGTSYLGSNLSYVFNSDYSRLNIHAVDGTIYVYQRKSSPTEGMMRVYESDDSPYNSYSFSNTQQNNSSSNNKTISQKKNRKEKKRNYVMFVKVQNMSAKIFLLYVSMALENLYTIYAVFVAKVLQGIVGTDIKHVLIARDMDISADLVSNMFSVADIK